MPLETLLNDLLKESLKAKDSMTADVVRMLKTKVMERRTAKGFTGTVDDALITQGDPGLQEAARQGHRGVREGRRARRRRDDKLRVEIAVCERFLPKGLSQDEVAALVKERIATLGITDGKQVGKLLGDIMKTHKGLVEANDVKKVAATLLS